MKKSILALCALFIFAGCSVSPNQDSSSSALSALNEALEDLGLDSSKVTIYELEDSSKCTEDGNNYTYTKTSLVALENNGSKIVQADAIFYNGTVNYEDKTYSLDNKLVNSGSYTGTYSAADAPEEYTYVASYTSYEVKNWNFYDEKYEEYSGDDEDEYYALKLSGSILTVDEAHKQEDGSYTVYEDHSKEYTKQ